MLAEAFSDAADDFVLAVLTQVFIGDDIGVVGSPMANAEGGILFNDGLEVDRAASGGMENGVAFIGGGPLGAGDKVLAALLGRVSAATGGGETGDESTLLIDRKRHRGTVYLARGRGTDRIGNLL